jgi:ubiquinone/menaquinone biosynthesis C-methylase UbiE
MTRSLAIRAWCTSVVAAIGAVTALSVVAQQTTGVHPIFGRRYAAVMDARGAEWLDRKERETEENPDEALSIIGIKKGTSVADIGAGSGYMTLRLSKRVGSNGVVYASDIQQPMLDILDQRLKSSRITNVQLVLGAPDDPKLPPASIDLALLVDVYHEFSQPQAMLRGIHQALKPGGRLVLLEYKKEDSSIPIRPEHKMSVSEAKMEVEPEGFRLGRVDDGLPWQHVLIFNKR